MEIAAAIISKIGEYMVELTVHQARYLLFRFHSILEDLRREEKKLILTQDCVQQDVERAIRNTEEIEKDVQERLTEVSNVMADVQRLEEEIQVNKARLHGWCPDWGWQYRLSRKAAKKTSIIFQLQDSGKFNKVAHRAILPGIEFFASTDFISFEATKSAFDHIIEALKDDNIKMVGVHGIGGVGKTTLVKAVGNKVQEQKIFDEVVIAVVSQHPNFKNIQGQLADSLSLKLEEESEEGRAKRLNLRFTETKSKILIILDDVWEELDFKLKLGIPFGDDHENCKILLTTRQKQVFTNIGCQSVIQLNILKQEEGLALLKRSSGIGDDSPSTLNPVAIHEVARECNGLPLALVTIGRALRGKGTNDWKIVSQKLKKSKLEDVHNFAGEKSSYACLKLSYDYLKGEEIRLCFLLCSLFPEDFEIPLEELVRCGFGAGLFQDANSIEDARNELHLMVDNLKDSCLLLDAGEDEFVKMHDMVHDVALWITSKGNNIFMGKAGMGLTEWPKEEGLEQHTAISLMGNKIKVLPIGLVCPELEILLLSGESRGHMMVVSDQFFEKMTKLKVVTISYGDLSLKSLEFLTNLQTLQLISCNLRDMSSLGKLKKLQILGLQYSFFSEIPEEFGELSELRLLDLGIGWFPEKTSSPSMIKRFSRLEELYADIGKWEVEGCILREIMLTSLS